MVKTILVVDDERDIQVTVKEILVKNGYSVDTADNADESLEKVKDKKYDLVLMDIMMPGTPVREIVPKLAPTKVAYLSVVRTTEAEREKLLKGKNVVGFIQKPFSITDLLDKVSSLA